MLHARYWPGQQSLLSLVQSTSQPTHMALGRPQNIYFQVHSRGYWQASRPSLLARDISFFPVSLQREPTTCQLASHRGRKQANEKMRVPKTEATVFCNLISEVTSCYFCHILFIRSKSLGPAHTEGKGMIWGHEYQEVGIFGSHLKGCLLTPVTTSHWMQAAQDYRWSPWVTQLFSAKEIPKDGIQLSVTGQQPSLTVELKEPLCKNIFKEYLPFL